MTRIVGLLEDAARPPGVVGDSSAIRHPFSTLPALWGVDLIQNSVYTTYGEHFYTWHDSTSRAVLHRCTGEILFDLGLHRASSS